MSAATRYQVVYIPGTLKYMICILEIGWAFGIWGRRTYVYQVASSHTACQFGSSDGLVRVVHVFFPSTSTHVCKHIRSATAAVVLTSYQRLTPPATHEVLYYCKTSRRLRHNSSATRYNRMYNKRLSSYYYWILQEDWDGTKAVSVRPTVPTTAIRTIASVRQTDSNQPTKLAVTQHEKKRTTDLENKHNPRPAPIRPGRPHNNPWYISYVFISILLVVS